MMPLRLDYEAHGRDVRIGMAALVLGLVVLALVSWFYLAVDGEVSTQETTLAALRSKSAQHRVSLPEDNMDAAQIAREVKQANATILELSLPWKQLFEALESFQGNDVAVLSIEPDARKGEVRISAESKSLDSMVGYLAYLQKVPLFRDVALQSHQVEQQDPQKPVRFVVRAAWGAR